MQGSLLRNTVFYSPFVGERDRSSRNSRAHQLVHLHTHGGQRSPGILLYHIPPYAFEIWSLIEAEARLAASKLQESSCHACHAQLFVYVLGFELGSSHVHSKHADAFKHWSCIPPLAEHHSSTATAQAGNTSTPPEAPYLLFVEMLVIDTVLSAH